MSAASCEKEVMRRLAEMPFLDRLELAAVSGWSGGAVYRAVKELESEGTVQAVPHASDLVSPTRRYCVTADGLQRLAQDQGTTVDRLLRRHPVSQGWRRILLERLDAVAVIYRLSAVLAGAAYPIRFRWYRAGPLDAGIVLPGGRTIGIVRQGDAADRTAFGKRLWRLGQEARPGGVLLLVPDEVRLRQAQRLLDAAPIVGFLALEDDAAKAGAGSQVWRTPSGGVPLSLSEVLAYAPSGGELPCEPPPRGPRPPANIEPLEDWPEILGWMLPMLLKPTEKRALDLLFDWPWLTPDCLGGLLGVRQTRLYQVLEPLKTLGLADVAMVEGNRSLTLTDRGLGMLARRDRAAVGAARQRWSAQPVDPKGPVTWRNVSGSRSRQLLRNLEHTQAVHWFLAALAVQSRARGWPEFQFDPPRRASRFFRHDGTLHSVRPDAFGILSKEGKQQPFFLEWERRAVRPVTMAARVAPYLRYYATRRPLDDHGSAPLVLVVFDDDIAAGHFLRVADDEMRRAGVKVPLWVSDRDVLERLGPLGIAWQSPHSWGPACPFN